jgi:hypothetical protein
MLSLKITLVPLAIAFVSLVGLFWGSKAAGIAASFPVVAGPILLLLAIQMGPEFAKAASISAIASVAASEIYNLAYARASCKAGSFLSLAFGLAAWALVAILLTFLPHSLTWSVAAALAAILLSYRCLPLQRSLSVGAPLDWQLLGIRMACGGILALMVTSFAAGLGTIWSGMLTVFPILGIVMTVSVHRNEGSARVADICRGMLAGRHSFIAFCLVLSLRLGDDSIQVAFVKASIAALAAFVAGQILAALVKVGRQ